MSIVHYDTPGQSFYAKFLNAAQNYSGSFNLTPFISDSGLYQLTDATLTASGLPRDYYDVVIREGVAISAAITDAVQLYRSFLWNGTGEVGLNLNSGGFVAAESLFLQTQVSGVAANLSTISGNINTLTTNLNTGVGSLSSSINLVNTNLTNTSGTLSNIGTRLDTTSGNVNTLSINLNNTSGTVSSIGTRLNTVSGNINIVNANLTNVSGNLNTVSSNVSTVSTNVSTVSTNVDTINTRTSSIQTTGNATYSTVTNIVPVLSGMIDAIDIQFTGSLTLDNAPVLSGINSILAAISGLEVIVSNWNPGTYRADATRSQNVNQVVFNAVGNQTTEVAR